VISPQITHLPCDLNQQQKRRDARRDSVARAVAWHGGRRSWIDRVFQRSQPRTSFGAEDLRGCGETEDVFHSFRF
jgi:hypothetical protein